ncbi:LacI family DNA-binding transcriptional regulator [Cohnella faecalis]|uniref:LacI family transcriptional regulator n=1 Tax=Cohnella faecalis TaxID=2315694 RepID=A0A398CFB7_9BACL|nr:LacI family DNA-binding transcriptional regulator [Cohnella faecalis]RIE01105.1 LacI family transcriptional regulator [Cohnella faecalis]
MGITIGDIAKKANVSKATVSRVISDHPKISAKTKERVLKVMDEFDYHPNMIARSLAHRSTKIIGVVIPGISEKSFKHPFFPEMLRGAASVAQKNHYNILMSAVSTAEMETQVINELAKGGIVEGIILMGATVHDKFISELLKLKFPFVVVGRPENQDSVSWVDNDNVQAAYELTKHFIEQGHSRIAFLGASSIDIVVIDRLEGYKKAMREHGLPINEKLIIEDKNIDGDGYAFMKALMKRQEPMTGLIAMDDFMAFGAIKYINECGLSVPDDIAVAGFNNVLLSNYSTPPLTSVEVNPFHLGTRAFELLIANLTSSYKSIDRAIIPADLVVRQSTLRGTGK